MWSEAWNAPSSSGRRSCSWPKAMKIWGNKDLKTINLEDNGHKMYVDIYKYINIYTRIHIYIYIVIQAQFSMARKNPALHRALTTEVLGVDLMSRCRWLGRVITPKWCVYIYICIYICMYMWMYMYMYVYIIFHYIILHCYINSVFYLILNIILYCITYLY